MPMMLGQCLRGVCDCCRDDDGTYLPFSEPKPMSPELQKLWEEMVSQPIKFETDDGRIRATITFRRKGESDDTYEMAGSGLDS